MLFRLCFQNESSGRAVLSDALKGISPHKFVANTSSLQICGSLQAQGMILTKSCAVAANGRVFSWEFW